jgi:hypothetical protein
MRIGQIEVRRRVWVGLFCALGVTAVWWAWNRAQVQAVAAAAQPRQPFVRLARSGSGGGDQLLRERAEYFDPNPLFFPTEKNYGQNALRESLRRQPESDFDSFEAKLTFAEQNIKPFSSDATAAPERLADVLGQGNERPFGGMGQIDPQNSATAEAGVFLEIRGLLDSKLVMSKTLAGLSIPHFDYEPLEFLAVISSEGLVGEPVLMTGSGKEEVDAFLRVYLEKSFRLGERLSPGRYRVLVGR